MMDNRFSIQVIRGSRGTAKVYINGEKIPGERLVQIGLDFTAGSAPQVHLVYQPDEFFMEAPNDD